MSKIDPKKFYQLIIDKKGNPSVKDLKSLGYSEGVAVEMISRMANKDKDSLVKSAKKLLGESLNEDEDGSLVKQKDRNWQTEIYKFEQWYIAYSEEEFGVSPDESSDEFEQAYKNGKELGILYSTFDDWDDESEYELQVSVTFDPAAELIYVNGELVHRWLFANVGELCDHFIDWDFNGIYDYGCDIARQTLGESLKRSTHKHKSLKESKILNEWSVSLGHYEVRDPRDKEGYSYILSCEVDKYGLHSLNYGYFNDHFEIQNIYRNTYYSEQSLRNAFNRIKRKIKRGEIDPYTTNVIEVDSSNQFSKGSKKETPGTDQSVDDRASKAVSQALGDVVNNRRGPIKYDESLKEDHSYKTREKYDYELSKKVERFLKDYGFDFEHGYPVDIIDRPDGRCEVEFEDGLEDRDYGILKRKAKRNPWNFEIVPGREHIHGGLLSVTFGLPMDEPLKESSYLSDEDMQVWREVNKKLDSDFKEQLKSRYCGPGYYDSYYHNNWNGKNIHSTDYFESEEDFYTHIDYWLQGTEEFRLVDIKKQVVESLKESTTDRDWEEVCKTYCMKKGYEFLFANDSDFGYYDPKSDRMVHKYADELAAELGYRGAYPVYKESIKEDYCDMFGCESGFFTRDDLNELMGEINERCPKGMKATGAYMSNDGRTLEVDMEDEEWGEETIYKKIDMRKIRKPSDLLRYANSIITEFENKVSKQNESLKESADKEIDRKGFKSLIKYGVHDDGGNYAVLNDGNFVRKFWADNDDEAKVIFRRGPSHKPELTQDPMAAGQWYESFKGPKPSKSGLKKHNKQ